MNTRELSNLAILEGKLFSAAQAAGDLESTCLLSPLLAEKQVFAGCRITAYDM